MKLKLRLNTRMLIFILSTSIIIYGLSIGFVSIELKKKALDNTLQLADTYAYHYASQSKSNLDKYMVAARTLEQTFENYTDLPENQRRNIFLDMMSKVLSKNDDFIAVWSIWEPHSIDNLDEQYIKKPGSTFIGNFSPTLYKSENQVKLQQENSTVLFQGDYYTVPKKSHKETIMDPYYYSYTGDKEDEILETNMIAPIIKSGQFCGVVGIDVPLDLFNLMVSRIKPFESGYAFILANNGVFVGHPDNKYVGKSFSDFSIEYDKKYNVIGKIKKGEKFSFQFVDPKTGELCYISFAPVHVGNSTTPWSFAIVVPVKTIIEAANRNFFYSIVVGILGLLVLTLVIVFIARTITNPIIRTTKLLQDIARGEINVSKKIVVKTTDEIGEMNESVNKLIDNLNETVNFASQIGQGNLKAEYLSLHENDVLGNSLLKMRDSLVLAQKDEQMKRIEDDKRNWVTQGQAKFGEILRENNDNIDELSFSIVKNLVEYIGSAQCAFFIVNDDHPDEICYELKAVIAFGRRKMFEKVVLSGEELVGRAAEEKISIHIRKAPENYVFISQGLSTFENPRSVLIVPLNLNDIIYGVIELVSFTDFEPHHIEFIEKVGESIASAIASLKVNLSTERLLNQSKRQEDELSQQEEEMRQNLEEMQATQEESAKREAELRGILGTINSVAMVAELDLDGGILKINESLAHAYGSNPEGMIGKFLDEYIPKTDEELNHQRKMMESLLEGNPQKNIRHLEIHNKEVWLNEHYTPVYERDNVKRIILIAIDITEDKLVERQIKKLEEEIKKLESENSQA